jgi:hypothetical protein
VIVSHQFRGAWQRAATTSVIWQAMAPARRTWSSAETAMLRAIATRRVERHESLENKEARTMSIVRSSRLFQMVDRMLTIAIAAWCDSVFGAMSRQVIDRVKERTVAERVRLAGGVTAVASATALVMQRLAPRPAPLTWIVPALCLFVGVGLIAVARERPAR